MVGFFLLHRAMTLSMPGTVFQYCRVTGPDDGSHDAAAAPLSPVDGWDEEHAVSAATPATTVSTAPARRKREVVGVIASFRTTAGGGADRSTLTPGGGLSAPSARIRTSYF